MSSAQIEQTTWINWASQTFCIMGLATGKVSVAILMGRLMSPSRWRKWVLYFLSISSLIVACVVIITNFAQCSPPRTLWIPSAGKCWDFKRTNDLDVAIASMYTMRNLYSSIDIVPRLVRVCGFCPRYVWYHSDLEPSNEQEDKGQYKCFSRFRDLVSNTSSVSKPGMFV